MGKLDDAGRTIAGLIGYNPGPGIYSRLERAIEDMPANVRVQELPGLLKRYKEGVPGWEIKEVLTPDLTEGVQSISRQDLLDAVKERSPIYTHSEVLLGDVPNEDFSRNIRSRIGEGRVVERPAYKDYGQGGRDYRELLIRQPGAKSDQFGGHWWTAPGGNQAVAHARFDTHGDALRINELQSDLGIHNRKAREARQQLESQVAIPENYAMAGAELPFPLEDAWADILIKRLTLEAARQGHRAIEVASPRAIADKVGGNIDNYEHFYGKVVPGAIERLGRKMGGLTEDVSNVALPPAPAQDVDAVRYAGRPEIRKLIREFQGGDEYAGPEFWKLYRELMHSGLSHEARGRVYDYFGESVRTPRGESEIANDIYDYFAFLGHTPEAAQKITSRALMEAPRAGRLQDHFATQQELRSLAPLLGPTNTAPGRRYIMSDEMRRRILTQGIGAAVAAPVLSDDELIERLNQ